MTTDDIVWSKQEIETMSAFWRSPTGNRLQFFMRLGAPTPIGDSAGEDVRRANQNYGWISCLDFITDYENERLFLTKRKSDADDLPSR